MEVEELKTIGIALNDGRERGWKSKVSNLLSIDRAQVIRESKSSEGSGLSTAHIKQLRIMYYLKATFPDLFQDLLVLSTEPVGAGVELPQYAELLDKGAANDRVRSLESDMERILSIVVKNRG